MQSLQAYAKSRNENLHVTESVGKSLFIVGLSQLGESVVSADGEYDVGYMKGPSRLCIHSEVDLDEIWSKILRGVACTLWCDGLAPQEKSKSVSKRLYYDGSDSDSENLYPLPQKKKKTSAIEEKNQHVQELIWSIQDKHGEKFYKDTVQIVGRND